MKKFFLLVCSVLALSACHKDPKPKMAELPSFQQTVQVHQVWATSEGGSGRQYLKLKPTVDGDRVYVCSYKGYVTALDAQNGRQVWQMNAKQPITSGVGTGPGRVYVGTGKGEVLALNQQNGAVAWRSAVTNEVLAPPSATSNMVLVKSSDDHLYALNAQNGQPVWDYREQTPELVLRGGSSPQIAGNLAVVGFANGQIGVYQHSNGQPLWKFPIADPKGATVIEQMVDINDTLAVADNTIYVATYQGTIAAVDLHNGQIHWQHDVSAYSGLSVDAHNVYVTNADGHVIAFNRQNGSVAWKQDRLFGRNLTGPAVMGSYIVVGDGQGYVHWLSAEDGRFLARAAVDKKGIISTPVVVGNNVYIYSKSGRLVKYLVS